MCVCESQLPRAKILATALAGIICDPINKFYNDSASNIAWLFSTETTPLVTDAARPRLWNSLPGPLRQSETLTTFKRHLKTCLFSD